jgi:hypothetical protein
VPAAPCRSESRKGSYLRRLSDPRPASSGGIGHVLADEIRSAGVHFCTLSFAFDAGAAAGIQRPGGAAPVPLSRARNPVGVGENPHFLKEGCSRGRRESCTRPSRQPSVSAGAARHTSAERRRARTLGPATSPLPRVLSLNGVLPAADPVSWHGLRDRPLLCPRRGAVDRPRRSRRRAALRRVPGARGQPGAVGGRGTRDQPGPRRLRDPARPSHSLRGCLLSTARLAVARGAGGRRSLASTSAAGADRLGSPYRVLLFVSVLGDAGEVHPLERVPAHRRALVLVLRGLRLGVDPRRYGLPRVGGRPFRRRAAASGGGDSRGRHGPSARQRGPSRLGLRRSRSHADLHRRGRRAVALRGHRLGTGRRAAAGPRGRDRAARLRGPGIEPPGRGGRRQPCGRPSARERPPRGAVLPGPARAGTVGPGARDRGAGIQRRGPPRRGRSLRGSHRPQRGPPHGAAAAAGAAARVPGHPGRRHRTRSEQPPRLRALQPRLPRGHRQGDLAGRGAEGPCPKAWARPQARRWTS